VSEIDSPSIFGSPTKAGVSSFRPRKRRARAQNSAKSVASKALSSESMGTPWRTLAKPVAGAAPTLCEGESGRTREGKRASMAALRRRSASYSASVISGASRSW